MRLLLSVGGIAVAAVVAACPPATTACRFDTDCSDGRLCVSGACEEPAPPTCEFSEPCEDDRGCPGGYCALTEGDALGCCVVVDLCFADADCPPGCFCMVNRGLCSCEMALCDPFDQSGCPADTLCAYTDGEPRCLNAAPAAASCEVVAGGRVIGGSGLPQPALTASGVPLRLRALARDEQGRLAPHAAFSFAGDSVLADGLFQATCAGPEPCTFEVEATTNGAACTGRVRVLPPAPQGASRALVIDIDTGAPLAGVPVGFGVAGVIEVTMTDALGQAFGFLSGAPWDSVSAFPSTHEWQTVLGASSDVMLYTRALVAPARVAGVKGRFDFTSLSTQGDIKLGIAGVALRGGPTALNARAIVGDATPTEVEIEGVTDPGAQTLALPATGVLEHGNDKLKEELIALGAPGGRIAWALGGKLRLSEIGPRALPVLDATASTRGAALLRMLAPALSRFDHDVETDLPGFPLVDRPADDEQGAPAPYASWELVEREFRPNTLVSRDARYALPMLPCAGGASPACTPPLGAGLDASPFAEGVLLLSGALVPADGLVPLGLGAAFDVVDLSDDSDAPDGLARMDNEGGTPVGEALFDYAPAHDGLEGHPILHIALTFEERFDPFADPLLQRTSALVARQQASTSDLSSFDGPFLEIPRATYAAQDGVVVVEEDAAAHFSRLVLDDGAGATWHVWFAGETDAIELVSLAPLDVDVEERAVRARIESFRVGASVTADGVATLSSLMSVGGDEVGDLFDVVTAWSGGPCVDP